MNNQKEDILDGLLNLRREMEGVDTPYSLVVEVAIRYIERVPHTYGEETCIRSIACYGCKRGRFCEMTLDLQHLQCKQEYKRAKSFYEREIKVGYYR